MTTNLKELFAFCVQEAVKSAKSITEPYQKSQAYSNVALALATMRGTSDLSYDENVSEKEAIQEPVPKAKSTAKESAPTNSKASKTESTSVPEPELINEWTEEMLALKAEQIDTLTKLKEEYGEEAMDNCVSMYTEGVYNSLADITPLNIDGFIVFLEQLMNEANN